jgi:hypothetical protein
MRNPQLPARRRRAKREWACDRQSPVGRLDKALDETKALGCTVVNMNRCMLGRKAFRDASLSWDLVEDRRLQTGQAICSWFTLESRPEQLGRNDLDSHAREAPPDHAELVCSAFGEINNASP